MRNNPDLGKMWGLCNTGQPVAGVTGMAGADTGAARAWTISRGGRNVVIAIIDTGIDLDHPDLLPNIMPCHGDKRDFVGDASIHEGDRAHGTHIAGIAAAAGAESGMIGVAPNALILPLRIDPLDENPRWRAEAINSVATRAAADSHRNYIINCSWKMSGHDEAVQQAIQRAVKNNALVICAAANESRNMDDVPFYPAVYPEVITVAAIDQRNRKAGFSNYGKAVDVAAPGVRIFSTHVNGGYRFDEGTSMAAAYVSGLAALIWSKNRFLTNAGVRTLIEGSCDGIDHDNPGFEGLLGKGRINAWKAISNTPYPNDAQLFDQLTGFNERAKHA